MSKKKSKLSKHPLPYVTPEIKKYKVKLDAIIMDSSNASQVGNMTYENQTWDDDNN